jgi:hypothetical protein
MAHFAVRGLMHEAALKADEDPDRLSFLFMPCAFKHTPSNRSASRKLRAKLDSGPQPAPVTRLTLVSAT